MTVEPPELASEVAPDVLSERERVSPSPAAPGSGAKLSDAAVPPPRPSGSGGIRIDRWLWAARFFKTRSQANKACVAGHVKVNEQTVKAAKLVRPGDEVDVETKGGRRLVDVVQLADKRGAAKVAATLYHDRTPPPPPKPEGGDFAHRDRGAGRPEKRDRRLLIRLRGR